MTLQRATVQRFGPGEAAQPDDFQPGDFILTHSDSFTGWLIRFGQGIRYWGPDRKYTHWNHAAVVVSKDGDLIEALGGQGVKATHIKDYAPTEYHLVHLDAALANERDRDQAVAFARACLGEDYGYITLISGALCLLTGCKFTFGVDGQAICSGLVARCLERTFAIFQHSPAHMSPAELAKYFDVEPPPSGTPIGGIPKRK